MKINIGKLEVELRWTPEYEIIDADPWGDGSGKPYVLPSARTEKRLKKRVLSMIPAYLEPLDTGYATMVRIPRIKALRRIVSVESGGVLSLAEAKRIVESWE